MSTRQIKSITFFLSCLLLAILTMPAIACPPPPCDDCYTWNPETEECEWDCGECCECVDGSCEPCKCWDDGDPISGSITVQNAKLCEEKTHTSSISDTDHWHLGGDGDGYPSDSITYSWSASDGTWDVSNQANFTWTAPACTGPVTITLTADDVPDSMDNPCPGSTRNDSAINKSGTSTVSLPTGCSTGTKSASLQSQIVGKPNCPSGTCGATEFTGASATIEAKYNDCKWVFQVAALADVLSGDCPSNYCNIETGQEAYINEHIYCGIVYRFINTDGCVMLGDFIPSSTPCVEIHEAKHYEVFETTFSNKESWLMNQASMSDMVIDCADLSTTTCQAAVAARRSAIKGDIVTALNAAWAVASDEGPPEEAARPCFTAIADLICSYAQSQGWPSCSYCP